MRRRDFIGLLGGTATFIPLIAWAQQAVLIGVLNAASVESNASSYEAFRAALRQLGYVEGRNIRFEYRYADGFLDRLPALAEELVRLNPQVIVSGPLPANLAARKATATIPIVMATGADPVGFGLVQSLHRPGGNVTGLANFAEELASKQIDVIQELLPRLARVAAQCREPVARAAIARDAGRRGQGVASAGAFRIPRSCGSGTSLRPIRARKSRGPSGAAGHDLLHQSSAHR